MQNLSFRYGCSKIALFTNIRVFYLDFVGEVFMITLTFYNCFSVHCNKCLAYLTSKALKSRNEDIAEVRIGIVLIKIYQTLWLECEMIDKMTTKPKGISHLLHKILKVF